MVVVGSTLLRRQRLVGLLPSQRVAVQPPCHIRTRGSLWRLCGDMGGPTTHRAASMCSDHAARHRCRCCGAGTDAGSNTCTRTRARTCSSASASAVRSTPAGDVHLRRARVVLLQRPLEVQQTVWLGEDAVKARLPV